MEVRTCKQCKRLFNYLTGAPLCPDCRNKLEEKFQVVKEYIREHPLDGIKEVAEVNDVSPAQIRRWIREERLSFSPESGVGIECESCGTMIYSGRLCQKCKDRLLGRAEDMYKEEESFVARKHKEAARMRFLDQ